MALATKGDERVDGGVDCSTTSDERAELEFWGVVGALSMESIEMIRDVLEARDEWFEGVAGFSLREEMFLGLKGLEAGVKIWEVLEGVGASSCVLL